jgi:hypothetical protein
MEEVRTSETLAYFYKTTRRYVPEGYHLQENILLLFAEHAGLLTQSVYLYWFLYFPVCSATVFLSLSCPHSIFFI